MIGQSQVCRLVVESNIGGFVHYDWMTNRGLAEALLILLKKMVESKPHIELIQTYIECAVSYIT